MKLSDFIKACAEDCANGGSGRVYAAEEDMMAEHTPGPWDADLTPMPSGPMWVACADGGALADVYQIEANARLIAAAPELLKYLRILSNCAERLTKTRSQDAKKHTLIAISAARAAIAKAEGKA